MSSLKFQACLKSQLAKEWGFDIMKTFPVQLYNQAVEEKNPQWQLPTYGRENTLGCVVGNTQVFWDRLKSAVANKKVDINNNPVDSFVELGIKAATKAALEECNLEQTQQCLRFSHGKGTEFVHIQLATTISGLAYFNPICHLNIHPEYGPWSSLRGLLVFDLPVEAAQDMRSTLSNPYPEGDAKLQKTFNEIIAPGYKADWKDWLRLRDVAGEFSPATKHRFSEQQLRYHYIYDLECLTTDRYKAYSRSDTKR